MASIVLLIDLNIHIIDPYREVNNINALIHKKSAKKSSQSPATLKLHSKVKIILRFGRK
jgi:hypothetical protein